MTNPQPPGMRPTEFSAPLFVELGGTRCEVGRITFYADPDKDALAITSDEQVRLARSLIAGYSD